MTTTRLAEFTTRIAASPEALFAWHARPGAFERLSPPWNPAELLAETGGIAPGARKTIGMRMGPLRIRWVAEHTRCEPPRLFQDRQLRGPFASWLHTHEIASDGAGGSVLTDRVEYAPPLGILGSVVAGRAIAAQLARVFARRHAVTAADLAASAAANAAGATPMKILVSGPSGLVGGHLIPFLTSQGHTVVRLVRGAAQPGEVAWAPGRGEIDRAALAAAAPDAVVHLAGDNISQGRWNEAKKRRIRDSRAKGTALLAGAVAALPAPPKVFVCASAIGWYGSRCEETLTESSASGGDFLASVCRDWEAACEPARAKGIRVVNLRFGVILSPEGGALKKLLLPFKLGGGGVVGTGAQWMSWLTLDDALGAIHHALTREALAGPVNAVAPAPVTNREFTKTLGRVLNRPTILPLPAFAARLVFGEMADALLLASTRVEPARLKESGYAFRHPALEPALRELLGR